MTFPPLTLSQQRSERREIRRRSGKKERLPTCHLARPGNPRAAAQRFEKAGRSGSLVARKADHAQARRAGPLSEGNRRSATTAGKRGVRQTPDRHACQIEGFFRAPAGVKPRKGTLRRFRGFHRLPGPEAFPPMFFWGFPLHSAPLFPPIPHSFRAAASPP